MANDVIKINRPFTQEELTSKQDVIKINRPFTNEEFNVQKQTSFMQKGLEGLTTGAGLGLGGYGAYKGIKAVKGVASNIADYPYNKTLAIRKGLLENRKIESSAYGKVLRTISKESSNAINGSGLLENMEVTLRQKGILGQFNEKAGIPANEIDRQLLKSYNNLMDKFAKSESGKIPLNEVLQEARNIKAKGGKVGTFKNKLASDLHDSIIESVKPQIKSAEFKSAQQRYATYKEKHIPLEEIFKPFENKFKTIKGEKVLSDIYSQPIGTQKALKNIPEITGQKIKGAKIIGRIQQANPLRLLSRGGRILGFAPMALQAIDFSRQMKEAKKKGMYKIDNFGNIIPLSKEDLAI